MRARWELAAGLGALLLAGAPRSADAHGTAPGVVARLGPSEDVQLTRGLGVRRGGSWRYVCPARWQGNAAARVFRMGDGPTWVAESGKLWRLEVSEIAEAVPFPAGVTDSVIELAAFDSGITGAALTALPGGGVRLWALGTAANLIWQSSEVWSGMANVDGRIWLVGGRPDGLAVTRVSADGSAEAQIYPVPSVPGTPRIVAVAAADGERQAFVILSDLAAGGSGTERMGRLTTAGWEPWGPPGPPTLQGPIVLGGHVLVAQGGAVRRVDSGAIVITDASRQFTGLGGHPGAWWVAARQDLRALNPAGQAGDVLFDVGWLTPPWLADLDSATSALCWEQWTDFAVDAGIPVGVPAPDADSDATAISAAHGGCQGGSARAAAGLTAWLLLACAAVGTIGRRRPR